MKLQKKLKSGFTLIEISLVILALLLLVGVLVTSVRAYTMSTDKTRCIITQNSILKHIISLGVTNELLDTRNPQEFDDLLLKTCENDADIQVLSNSGGKITIQYVNGCILSDELLGSQQYTIQRDSNIGLTRQYVAGHNLYVNCATSIQFQNGSPQGYNSGWAKHWKMEKKK